MSSRDEAFRAYRERAISAMLDHGDAIILRAGGVLPRATRRRGSPKVPTLQRHWVLDCADHMRLRWDRARPHLDIQLEFHQWAVQLAALETTNSHLPAGYDPPPRIGVIDNAALIAAPRPGPSYGMLAAA